MHISSKACRRCGQVLPLCHFAKDRTSKDGRQLRCKSCNKADRDATREQRIKYLREYRQTHKAQISEKRKIKYEKEKGFLTEARKEYFKRYAEENREQLREKKRIYRENNPEKERARHQRYYSEHISQIRAKERNRKLTDPLFRLKANVRTLVGHAFRSRGFSKTSRTFDIVGCDADTLKYHLEKTFVENYGILPDYHEFELHIDHIVPLASASTEEEGMELNHFTNLQLLLATDNLTKSWKLQYSV
jgi:hypothetical protein